ncbi:MAG: hypothetical protein PUF97_04275 [Bifidobacteriaceae bacterium]|nr:hypothetical protein [Bifidobacteriaceae bacterium]
MKIGYTKGAGRQLVRIVALLLLSCAMVLSLAACGSTPESKFRNLANKNDLAVVESSDNDQCDQVLDGLPSSQPSSRGCIIAGDESGSGIYAVLLSMDTADDVSSAYSSIQSTFEVSGWLGATSDSIGDNGISFEYSGYYMAVVKDDSYLLLVATQSDPDAAKQFAEDYENGATGMSVASVIVIVVLLLVVIGVVILIVVMANRKKQPAYPAGVAPGMPAPYQQPGMPGQYPQNPGYAPAQNAVYAQPGQQQYAQQGYAQQAQSYEQQYGQQYQQAAQPQQVVQPQPTYQQGAQPYQQADQSQQTFGQPASAQPQQVAQPQQQYQQAAQQQTDQQQAAQPQQQNPYGSPYQY